MEINIIVFSFLIAGVVVALVFSFAFFLELIFDKKGKKNQDEAKGKEVVIQEKDDELDLEEMLEKLEKQTRNEDKDEDEHEDLDQNVNTVDEKSDIDFDEMFARLEDTLKRVSEPSQTETKIEIKNIINEISTPEENLHEDIVLESLAESNLPIIVVPEVEEPKTSKVETDKKDVEVVCPDIDYASRLEKLKESLDKLEKDLLKSTKELRRFERTAKRKARNEKLLDKKAGELTNLNLVMYNINDIKNIDPEKKQKQEELVAHIAELKNSIKDADVYLTSNKEKNANAKKLNNFLIKEKVRYEEEIVELETLIQNSKKR